jgi:hypothetical protein
MITEAVVVSSLTSPSLREAPVINDHGFEVTIIC